YDSMTRIPVKTKSRKTKKEAVLRAVTYEIDRVVFPYGQDLVNEALNSTDRKAVAWRFEDAGN
ncbi:MAG: hypothetical protein ACLS3T_19260, partial [Anaerobutyricum sp.]